MLNLVLTSISLNELADISLLEQKFDFLWEQLFPEIDLDTEVRLIEGRRFKYDYVSIAGSCCVEINGQIWQVGGHSTGKGLMRDYEKLNLAQSLGYCVFQLSSEMITEEWLTLIANTIISRSQN